MVSVRSARRGANGFRRQVGLDKPKAPRRDVEGPIHESIVGFLYGVVPGAIVHFCKNEINLKGKQIRNELAKAAKMGARKGFPDILLMVPNMGTFYFEVKAPGNYPDQTQKELHEEMTEGGHKVAVVRSIDDVRKWLEFWNIPTREK